MIDFSLIAKNLILFSILLGAQITWAEERTVVLHNPDKIIPIFLWNVEIEGLNKFNQVSLNEQKFLIDLDQNKEFQISWSSSFESDQVKETTILTLPPSWITFHISINNVDVTPLNLQRPVKGRIYASNEILIPSNLITSGVNTIRIKMNGPAPLLGFRGSETPSIAFNTGRNIKGTLLTFLNNTIQATVYPFVSIALGILALLLLKIYSTKKEEHLFFALGNLFFQPYNFLMSDLYSSFSTTVDFSFKFQIYFQSISWTFWGYYFLSQMDHPKIKKIMYNKFFYSALISYFLGIGAIWNQLTFFQLSNAVTLPFLVPILVSPYWLVRQNNHHRFSFVLAFFCVVSGYITFFSHLTRGSLFLTGHTIFIFGILAFKDLLKNFTVSIRRDQSAGALLGNLLPKPLVSKISDLLTEGATFNNIRSSIQGDSVITTIFVDICSFGEMTRKLSSKTMTAVRVEVFEHLKIIAERHRHYFIKCVGDNIHFSSGFMGEGQLRQSEMSTSCLRVVKEMLDSIDNLNLHLKSVELPSIKIKISATIGHGEFGLEGTKEQVRYDVFGHWVNATKRLEDAMNSDFYSKYGYNCALVSTNLFNQCEDVQLRKRFLTPFEVTDKHGQTYSAYIGQQYETQVEKDDLLQAVYGQFAHSKIENGGDEAA